MPKLIDLSLPLTANVTVVPGHPTLSFHPIHRHETHGRSNTEMRASIHTGTHCDPPYHFVPGGKTIDQMPLERFMGSAVKIDLRRKVKPRTGITIDGRAHLAGLSRTGPQGKDRGVPHRLEPEDVRPAQLLLRTTPSSPRSWRAGWYSKRIKALALDSPQDQVQGTGEPRPGDFPVHRTFLGKGIPFIEHLANLHKVRQRTFTLIAFPIKIEGGDGAPCRAVAMV